MTLSVLLFGSVIMLGLAVDLARVGAAWREASHLATTAAEAGAGWIDPAAALHDRLRLDRTRAAAAARAVAVAPDRRVGVSTSATRVCVSVAIPVRPTLLSLVGARLKTVAVTACAEPRKG